MSADPLAKLDRCSEEWLLAGVASTFADPRRAELATVLASLGAKVPAAARAAEGLARITAAAASASAAEMLSLAALAAQVSGARAAFAGAQGTIAPLPQTEANLRSASSLEDVQRIADAAFTALREIDAMPPNATQRTSVYFEPALADDINAGDLRLLPLWAAMVTSPSEAVAAGGADGLLHFSLGKQHVPPLRRRFSLPGNHADGQWLRAVGRFRLHAIETLVWRSLELGGAETASAALHVLRGRAEHRTKALDAAKRIMASDRPLSLRIVALSYLAEEGDPSALDALLDAAGHGDEELRSTAVSLLGSLALPDVDARVREELTRACDGYVSEELGARAASGSATTLRGQAAALADAEKQRVQRSNRERANRVAVDRAASLSRVLTLRATPENTAALHALLDSTRAVPLRVGASKALLARGTEEDLARARALVADAEYALREVGLYAHALAGPAAAYEALSPKLTSGDPLAPQILLAFGQRALGEPVDPRWETVLRGLLRDPALDDDAAAALGQAGFRESIPALVEMLEARAKSEPQRAVTSIAEALAALRAHGTGPALVRLLDAPAYKQPHRRSELLAALEALCDPASEAPLRAYAQRVRHDRSATADVDRVLRAHAAKR